MYTTTATRKKVFSSPRPLRASFSFYLNRLNADKTSRIHRFVPQHILIDRPQTQIKSEPSDLIIPCSKYSWHRGENNKFGRHNGGERREKQREQAYSSILLFCTSFTRALDLCVKGVVRATDTTLSLSVLLPAIVQASFVLFFASNSFPVEKSKIQNWRISYGDLSVILHVVSCLAMSNDSIDLMHLPSSILPFHI